MIKSIHIHTLAITTAFAAMASLAMLVQSGAANAKSVMSCKGSSLQSVIDCCEDKVARKGLPIWMQQEGLNCDSAAMCSGGKSPNSTSAAASKRRCMIRQTWNSDGNGNQPKPHDRGKRGGQTGKN